jgi:AraC family transcriptional regulator
MDWLDRMNGAISHIEENLTGDIDYEDVARIACCSTYHFQRMFSFITDVTLSEYVRRRRLTMAAFELQNRDVKVIDLALKYGYDSPNSFTRAFQALHGVTPSSARDKGVRLKAYPRMTFFISIKGDVEMDYKIVEKGAFKMFGVEKLIDMTNNNFSMVPEFWTECRKNGTIGRLASIPMQKNKDGLSKLNSVMCYRDTGKDTFPYMIGIVDFEGSAAVPEDLVTLDVKPYTWAIFRSEEHGTADTSEKVQKVWSRIFPEWFPTSGYEHAVGPEFEMTYEVSGNKFYTEVWIPVIREQS